MLPSPLRFLSATLAVAVLGLVGCATAPQPRSYTVKVNLDPALAGSSLQVDLIGANPVSDLPKLQTYSVTSYWTPGDTLRRDSAKVTLAFGQGRPMTQMLDINDPIWQGWLKTGAQQLVVLVDLPGIEADKTGGTDPRRLILPLDAAQWGSSGILEIQIQESGARLLTPKKS
jgi:hypothetical protein